MAAAWYLSPKRIRIELQSVHRKEVWLKIDPCRVERSNTNIIPAEYFTATYYLQEPVSGHLAGEIIKDEDGTPKLFESPVAALAMPKNSCKK